jgi:uncharacterized membrane protein
MPTARRRLAFALAVVALLLVPWTVFITATLPAEHHTPHWRLAWGGFDVALAAAAAATAWAIARAPSWVPLPASITGTLLVCDAWFDILTAQPGGELREAILTAVLAELPLAALCFWLARDSERTLVRAVRATLAGD